MVTIQVVERALPTVRRALTGKSRTYDVRIGGIKLHAATLGDATSLAEKIADAINEHSSDEAEIRECLIA